MDPFILYYHFTATLLCSQRIINLSPAECTVAPYFQIFRKLTTFFKALGVKAIFDTSCSRDLALIEACTEFIMRYNKRGSVNVEENGLTLPMLSSACPGIFTVYQF